MEELKEVLLKPGELPEFNDDDIDRYITLMKEELIKQINEDTPLEPTTQYGYMVAEAMARAWFYCIVGPFEKELEKTSYLFINEKEAERLVEMLFSISTRDNARMFMWTPTNENEKCHFAIASLLVCKMVVSALLVYEFPKDHKLLNVHIPSVTPPIKKVKKVFYRVVGWIFGYPFREFLLAKVLI